MIAAVGDHMVIGGHRVGQPLRRGEIVEVRGADGAPPYLVRWDDSGRTTLLFPGPDCTIEHLAASSAGDAGEETS